MATVYIDIGELCYQAYGEGVGGTAFNDKPLPQWDELDERQRIGWRMAADAIWSFKDIARQGEEVAPDAACSSGG